MDNGRFGRARPHRGTGVPPVDGGNAAAGLAGGATLSPSGQGARGGHHSTKRARSDSAARGSGVLVSG
jgi:hypothetical protein